VSKNSEFFDIFYSSNLRFAVAVLMDDRQFSAASASTKREASMQAAYKALYQLSLDARQFQVKFILIFSKNSICFDGRDLIYKMIRHYLIVLHRKFYQHIEIYVLVYN
jgi:hypothetical protein